MIISTYWSNRQRNNLNKQINISKTQTITLKYPSNRNERLQQINKYWIQKSELWSAQCLSIASNIVVYQLIFIYTRQFIQYLYYYAIFISFFDILIFLIFPTNILFLYYFSGFQSTKQRISIILSYINSRMVLLVTRFAAMIGIAGITGLMWLQDHTKKVIVLKNTTQSVLTPTTTQTSTDVVGPVVVTQKIEPTENKGIIKKTTQIYNTAAENKAQKLGDKHIMFGALALIGSIFLPKLFFLLSVGYFAAYQLYYFATDGLQFDPIWKGFMAGGAGLFGYKLLKTARLV